MKHRSPTQLLDIAKNIGIWQLIVKYNSIRDVSCPANLRKLIFHKSPLLSRDRSIDGEGYTCFGLRDHNIKVILGIE